MKEFKECGNGFEQLIQYANGETGPKTVTTDISIYIDTLTSTKAVVGKSSTTFAFTPDFNVVDGPSSVGQASVVKLGSYLSASDFKAGTSHSTTWSSYASILDTANVTLYKDVVIETADGIKGKLLVNRYFNTKYNAAAGRTFTITVELELVK